MSPTGTLQVVDGRCVLRFERRLTHPVEKVWRAITEAEHLARWYPVERELVPEMGGAVREGDLVAGQVARGTVTAYDPPRLLEYTMSTEGIPMAGFGDVRTSRFELTPDPDGCLLVFIHTFDDRAGAASFAAGWRACLDALESVLAGEPIQEYERWTEAHEDYVERFGLADGAAEPAPGGGWVVRFERQLRGPSVDEVWALLTADPAGDETGPVVGSTPPPRFTNGLVPAAAISAVRPPESLEYPWLAAGAPAGRVRWELAAGPGGARVTLTQTIPPEAGAHRATALAAWHVHLELLAGRLRGRASCWPPERVEELRERYAARAG